MIQNFNLLNINVSDLIGSSISINDIKFKVIDIDDSDVMDIVINLKDSKKNNHTLTIERLTFKFLQDYGETQCYYYSFDGVYDNKILTISKI